MSSLEYTLLHLLVHEFFDRLDGEGFDALFDPIQHERCHLRNPGCFISSFHGSIEQFVEEVISILTRAPCDARDTLRNMSCFHSHHSRYSHDFIPGRREYTLPTSWLAEIFIRKMQDRFKSWHMSSVSSKTPDDKERDGDYRAPTRGPDGPRRFGDWTMETASGTISTGWLLSRLYKPPLCFSV